MKELWKDIKGYEDLYQISDFGRVKSLERNLFCKNGTIKHHKEKILKNSLSNTTGYYCVTLRKNNKSRPHRVHRLLALEFISNPKKLPCIDHINNNRIDNRIKNLRWCSKAENQYNKSLHKNNTTGFKGVYLDKRKKKNRYLAKIMKHYKEIYIGSFDNPVEAAKAYDKKAKKIFKEYANTNF